MPAPDKSLATLRPDLGASFMEFELEADRRGFASPRVLPVFTTGVQKGTFGKIPLEQLLSNRDTARAPGSGYSRGEFTFTEESFATVEHGAEETVDDREAEMYASFFDAEQVAAARAMDVVLRNLEKRVSDLVFNSSTWTGAALTTAVGTEWDTAATATPVADVAAAVQKVYDGSGLWPNAMIITRKVFNNLRLVAEIQDLVKYNGIMDPRQGAITEAALSQVFDLQVIVAGGTKNTAAEGQAATPSPIWDDEYCMVAKVAMSQDIREPCLGRIFHWPGDGSDIDGRVESYRDETVRSDIIRVRQDVDELILYKEAGHLLSNITT